ncbi:alpha/beta hydrolase family protein [Streptomyces sp. NPDC020192]|uniref:alpha/beta hydrolase family protein n=1 Tax=Streptomyces sp. NPDC020192 TaxID=3365066 RepID=UPI00379914CA
MNGIRRMTAAAALALLLPLPLIQPAFAAPAPAAHTAVDTPGQLALPRPTGPYAVGRDVLHLVDAHRTDPWVPAVGARQLMVSMYYPAHAGTGSPAPYMTVEEARLLLEAKAPGRGIPPETVASTRTWARTDARPVSGRHPLVVLSPGLGLQRSSLTGLAEDLASRGSVVALVDHTYEAAGVTFPDGRTLACAICDRRDITPEAVGDSRVKDLSFVIDRLTSRHPAWRHARLIDPRRIGMAGHSFGGDATALAMAADHRIRSGADLDGTFFAPFPAAGLHHRPFLLLGNQQDMVPGKETTWDAAWQHMDGWKRWLTVAGADHGSFTDLDLLYEELGRPTPTGEISGPRGEELTRAYLGAYFDQTLRGIHQPLLDGPSAANPEVAFQHP